MLYYVYKEKKEGIYYVKEIHIRQIRTRNES